jgi:hypothetical protein
MLMRLLLLLFLIMAFGCGCTITLGDGSALLDDDSGAEPEAPRLPDPTEWRVAPSPLTPEQQQRQVEVDQHVIEQYGDYRIIETTQGYSGDITDWVDSATIPWAFLTPPPPTWTQEDLQHLPEGAELARTELDLYPELRGPAGTTPIHRPDFSVYVMGLTDASSPQDYIDNYQVGGQPSDKNRLYAGLISVLPNMGVSGTRVRLAMIAQELRMRRAHAHSSLASWVGIACLTCCGAKETPEAHVGYPVANPTADAEVQAPNPTAVPGLLAPAPSSSAEEVPDAGTRSQLDGGFDSEPPQGPL